MTAKKDPIRFSVLAAAASAERVAADNGEPIIWNRHGLPIPQCNAVLVSADQIEIPERITHLIVWI